MQTTGYINLRGHGIILILVRQAKYGNALKLRKTGKNGHHFIEEDIHHNQNPDGTRWYAIIRLQRNSLLNNEVIHL